MLIALLRGMVVVCGVIGVGLMFEAVSSNRRVPASSARLNVGCIVLGWLAQLATAFSLAYGVQWVVLKLPGHGLLKGLIAAGVAGHIALPVMIVIWLAVGDFFFYWFHRAQHHWHWLWAEHELHHSDTEMNVTTAWRNHWLETPFQTVAVTGPLFYFFEANIGISIVFQVTFTALAGFTHLNTPWSLGRFNAWLANPHTHRIHHSREPEHRDKNFAVIFPVWDVLFGTYYQPRADERPATGTPEPTTTLGRAVVLPFLRWLT